MKRAMEHQPGGAGLGRLRVGDLELTEDLRLADDHRVEARADPEQMAHRVAAVEAVERAAKSAALDPAVGGEKAGDFVAGARGVWPRR